jgi:hypothetical protein
MEFLKTILESGSGRGVRRDLFRNVSAQDSGSYIVRIVCSDLLDREVAEALVALYGDGRLKITVLKSIDVFSNLVHVIVAFKKEVDALTYGISDNIPESIHAAFLGDRFITGYAFEPLRVPYPKDEPRDEVVRIVVLRVPTACDIINVLGTARTGADETYWTEKPRSFDPEIPFIDQAAEILTEETIKEGLWKLKNHTMTNELNPERQIVRISGP